MSHITSYPSSIKQLDLSHNQITVWPSLPQVEAQDMMEVANVTCYATNTSTSRDKLPIIGGNCICVLILVYKYFLIYLFIST